MAEIFEEISAAYERAYKSNQEIQRLVEKLAKGSAKYTDAWRYAEIDGMLSSQAALRSAEALLSAADAYPDIMEFLNRCCHTPVTEYTQGVQALLNKKNGISLSSLTADFDANRASGIAHNVAHAEGLDEINKMLGPSLRNFTENTVSNTIAKNAEFQSSVGLRPQIRRIADPRCCTWCDEVAGTYDYDKLVRGDDVWRRHDNCRCIIEFHPGPGYKRITAQSRSSESRGIRIISQ